MLFLEDFLIKKKKIPTENKMKPIECEVNEIFMKLRIFN